jgi:hypothetical protein
MARPRCNPLLALLVATSAAAAEKIIRTRSDLPTVPGYCTVQTYYVEHLLHALGTAAELLQAYHSAVAFESTDCSTQMPRMVLEWYALDFPYGAILPNFANSTLVWNNTAVVGMVPLNMSHWTKVHHIGNVSGTVFNAYCDWVLRFSMANPAYECAQLRLAAEDPRHQRHFARLTSRVARQAVGRVVCDDARRRTSIRQRHDLRHVQSRVARRNVAARRALYDAGAAPA